MNFSDMRKAAFSMVAVLFLALACRLSAQTRFVHAEGKFLADPAGHKLILRGTNLGNWLVPEGYMFRLEEGPQSAREIEAMVNELIGPTDAAKFWHEYRDGYITRKDIDFIAQAGFNTIRIPFHYKFFEPGNEEGFALVRKGFVLTPPKKPIAPPEGFPQQQQQPAQQQQPQGYPQAAPQS